SPLNHRSIGGVVERTGRAWVELIVPFSLFLRRSSNEGVGCSAFAGCSKVAGCSAFAGTSGHTRAFLLGDAAGVVVARVAVDGVDVSPAGGGDAVDVGPGRALLGLERDVDLRTGDREVD